MKNVWLTVINVPQLPIVILVLTTILSLTENVTKTYVMSIKKIVLNVIITIKNVLSVKLNII